MQKISLLNEHRDIYFVENFVIYDCVIDVIVHVCHAYNGL